MSLPLRWVEEIFNRLAVTYGSAFLDRYAGQDLTDIKTDWSARLAGLENAPSVIAYALQNLPARAPNVIEFTELCRRAPLPEVKHLPAPVADPALRERLLAAIKPLDQGSSYDHKAWARRLKARHEAGDKLSAFQVQCYREALRMVA